MKFLHSDFFEEPRVTVIDRMVLAVRPRKLRLWLTWSGIYFLPIFKIRLIRRLLP